MQYSPYQFVNVTHSGLAGDNNIETINGALPLSDLEDQTVVAWNGETWQRMKVFMADPSTDIYAVNLKDSADNALSIHVSADLYWKILDESNNKQYVNTLHLAEMTVGDKLWAQEDNDSVLPINNTDLSFVSSQLVSKDKKVFLIEGSDTDFVMINDIMVRTGRRREDIQSLVFPEPTRTYEWFNSRRVLLDAHTCPEYLEDIDKVDYSNLISAFPDFIQPADSIYLRMDISQEGPFVFDNQPDSQLLTPYWTRNGIIPEHTSKINTCFVGYCSSHMNYLTIDNESFKINPFGNFTLEQDHYPIVVACYDEINIVYSKDTNVSMLVCRSNLIIANPYFNTTDNKIPDQVRVKVFNRYNDIYNQDGVNGYLTLDLETSNIKVEGGYALYSQHQLIPIDTAEIDKHWIDKGLMFGHSWHVKPANDEEIYIHLDMEEII